VGEKENLDQHSVTTEEHEEKQTKITESAKSTAAAEHVSIKNSRVPLSTPVCL
jgi:hypothetical protein